MTTRRGEPSGLRKALDAKMDIDHQAWLHPELKAPYFQSGQLLPVAMSVDPDAASGQRSAEILRPLAERLSQCDCEKPGGGSAFVHKELKIMCKGTGRIPADAPSRAPLP